MQVQVKFQEIRGHGGGDYGGDGDGDCMMGEMKQCIPITCLNKMCSYSKRRIKCELYS